MAIPAKDKSVITLFSIMLLHWQTINPRCVTNNQVVSVSRRCCSYCPVHTAILVVDNQVVLQG
jgi:hypothetical protein